MSCYHPKRGIVVNEVDGKKKIKIVPFDIKEEYLDSFPIPCGKCVGCREDKAKEWSNRLLMESTYCKDKCYFITLTYDDEHAHWIDYISPRTGQFYPKETKHQASLDKKDAQNFMKRLRKEFPDQKLRFYLAGEYGGKTFRPHMHLILFNLDVPSNIFFPAGKSETGDVYFVCDFLSRIWSSGFHQINSANEFTFKYVANYVTKKIGVKSNKWYEDQGLVAPFNTMSRKPGIGAQYLIDHPEIMDNDRIVIGTSRGSYEFVPPRYFKKSYKELFPDRYEEHVAVVSKASEDRIYAIEKKTGLSYTEYLRTPEVIAESRLNRRDKI